MHIGELGVTGCLFIALVTGCGNDSKPGPGTTPTPDSGGTTDTGGSTPGDVGADAPQGDMRPCEGSTLATGNFKLTHMGVEYGYIVHVPPSYDGTRRTPLVFNWHGFSSAAFEQQLFSTYDAVSDEYGFISVFPNSPDKSWNAGTCCAGFIDGGMPDRDDVGFARALVAEISKAACIDSKRVYSTGMSNGGFMSHRLACEAADLFAAVAPVAGQMGIPTCQPSRPVPVMHFHGTADMTIPYDTAVFSPEGANVPAMAKRWADRDGCTKGPDTTYQVGTVTCQTWSQCTGNVLVTLCSAEGEGHCWPGTAFCPGSMPFTTDISASRAGWEFFQKFVLP